MHSFNFAKLFKFKMIQKDLFSEIETHHSDMTKNAGSFTMLQNIDGKEDCSILPPYYEDTSFI